MGVRGGAQGEGGAGAAAWWLGQLLMQAVASSTPHRGPRSPWPSPAARCCPELLNIPPRAPSPRACGAHPAAMIGYSVLFARFAWAIQPRNYLLFAMCICNGFVQTNQMRRWMSVQPWAQVGGRALHALCSGRQPGGAVLSNARATHANALPCVHVHVPSRALNLRCKLLRRRTSPSPPRGRRSEPRARPELLTA